jgi:hypothetical protein
MGLASLTSHGQPAPAVNTPQAVVPPPGLTGTLPTPASAAPAPAALATAPAPSRGVIVVEINGTINQDLVHKVRRALEDADPQRIPAGALLILNSDGGNGLSAMEIGRIARAARAQLAQAGLDGVAGEAEQGRKDKDAKQEQQIQHESRAQGRLARYDDSGRAVQYLGFVFLFFVLCVGGCFRA